MATIRITYCGMDGEGSTVREAKQDAARKLEHVMRQLKEPPVTITMGNQAALVALTHEGEWGNRLITDEFGRVRQGQQYISSGYADRRDAIRHAAKHVAQIAWSLAVEHDGEWLAENRPDALSQRDWAEDSRELTGYFAWQRRYAAHRALGKSDAECHDLASRGVAA